MEDLDAGLGKKAMQHALVGASLGSGSKPGPKLCEHDERHEDRLDGLQPLDDIALAVAQVAVAAGVDREPHRHRSGSVLR
jgi:hypothetical protein